MIWKFLFAFVFTVGIANVPQETRFPVPESTRTLPFYDRNYPWVDSLLNVMTLDQKVGQLFMVPAYSNREPAHAASIDNLIAKYHVGGLIFMQGGPARQAILTNRFQSLSEIPLLVGMDAEWGPAMRLDSVPVFQRQLTWGAMTNDSVVYQAGTVIAKQLQRLGVQVSFAPVIDINNNPDNPVIGDRSFGEDKYNVALKGLAYMNALQDHGVIACGKHFPGHGDVNTDSHLTLPVINHSYKHLDTLELYPFKVLMNEGLGSVMLAHLFIPALDSIKNNAASVSKKIGTDLLRDSLQFRGLVFSDALNMKGVSAFYTPGELELKAFLAGNDMLMFSENIPVAFAAIKQAVINGTISQDRLDASVRRILKAKAFSGLDHYTPVKLQNLWFDLNTDEAMLIRRKISEKSLTLASAKDSLIPFIRIDTLSIASLSVGDGSNSVMQTYLNKYTKVDQYKINKDAEANSFMQMVEKLKAYEMVVVELHDLKKSGSANYGITANSINLINKLSSLTNVSVIVFGTPYALGKISGAQYAVVAYDDDKYTQQAVAMALFGAIPFEGKLPVGSGAYKVNDGRITGSLKRLKYSIPEEAGMNMDRLRKIDSIAKACITAGAAPGCEVLVAKNGMVVWDKAYGSYLYDKKRPVTTTDIYDLASVTKISATTIGLMKLFEDSLFDIHKHVEDYLPDTKGTTIGPLLLSDILTHQSGLPAWIPFYKKTLTSEGLLDARYYSQVPLNGFSVKVADGIYMRDDYRDTMWNIIRNVNLKESNKYVYSDLGMYISRRILEKISGQHLDDYVYQHFYTPLGMQTTCFNPLSKFPKDRIVPTENDNYFRFQTVQGYVHDMGAAMMGGVEGHAGLFSDAEDLAILYQMLLNGGEYGGTRYFDKTTIDFWTKKQSSVSRRGLGFDKPDKENTSPASDYTSASAFGHQGFTGICVWADPEYDLLYIFLSNRVQPTAEPNKLSTEGIRNKIMDAIYLSLPEENVKGGAAADE